MSKAAWPLQVSLFGRLVTDMAPVPVYDAVPTGAAFPYVTIGEFTSTDEPDKSDDAEAFTITLHVWSRKVGRKETKELLAKLRTSLHEKPLTVTGHAPVSLRQEYATDFLDPDGLTTHGVIRFGALITTN